MTDDNDRQLRHFHTVKDDGCQACIDHGYAEGYLAGRKDLKDLEQRVKALEASEYKREVGTFWANNRDRILAAAEERSMANAGDDSPTDMTGDDDAN